MHFAADSVAKNRRTRFFVDTAMETESSLSKAAARLDLLHRNIFEYGLSVGSVIAARLQALEIHA